MESKATLRIRKQDVILYFVMFAFLYPRGFSETVPIYKAIFSLWTWLAVAIIWCQFFMIQIKKNESVIKINRKYIWIAGYFLLAILITIFIRKTVSSGLQQLIAYPSLFLFVVTNFKKKPERLLNCISNILLILFTINLFVFGGRFFNIEHLTFLGHVQIISQIGLLAIFSTVLEYMMTNRHKKKTMLIVIIALLNMLVTDADSAVLSAVIILFGGIVYKWRLYHLFRYKSTRYIWIMCAVSVAVIYLIGIEGTIVEHIPVLGFSGRDYVWEDAVAKIAKSPILGYGIDGVLLTPFWTEWTGGGFNYGHNQIVQNLLDGGIVLLISFWVMMLKCVQGTKRLPRKKYLVLVNVALSVLLFVMIFESPSLYCYMYIIMAIILVLPKVLSENQAKVLNNKE